MDRLHGALPLHSRLGLLPVVHGVAFHYQVLDGLDVGTYVCMYVSIYVCLYLKVLLILRDPNVEKVWIYLESFQLHPYLVHIGYIESYFHD